MRLSSACPAVALLTLLFTPVWLSADITCEQSVTIVRGAGNRVLRGMQGVGVGTPVTTKVFIHGDRMIRSSGQRDVLFDLEHGTVTQIRRDKKTYSVLTFEQYGTAMHLPAPGARKPGETPAGEAKFDVRVDDTHRTKKLNGVDLNQMLIFLTQDLSDSADPDGQPIELTMEAWIAADAGGTDEFTEFNRRLAEKLGSSADVSEFPEGMTPVLRQGMIRLMEASQQLHGILIEQSTRVTGPAGAGFDSGSSGGARDLGKQAKTGAKKVGHTLGNILGRVAGGAISGGTVPVPDKAPIPTGHDQSDAPRPTGESTDLLQMAVSTRNFNNAEIDESRFSVPPDYQKVESESPGDSQK